MKFPSRRSRSLTQNFQATFGRIHVPQAGGKALLAMGTVCLLMTGAASADWRVYDDNVEQEVQNVRDRIGNTKAGGESENENGTSKGTITGNQKLSYEQYTLGTYKASGTAVEHPQWPAGARTENPDGTTTTESGFKLDKFSDMAGGKEGSGGGKAMALNSNIARCGGARAQQKTICEEIVKTENAQFIYNVRFHEVTAKRLERLKEIEQEREALEDKPENYGKLQDNTNKLLALNTRMGLDNTQMESAMHAYDARLAFLKAYQAQKTREMMRGESSGSGRGLFDIDLGSLGGAVVGGAVLKGALEAQKSDKPAGYKRMEWL